MKVLITCVGTRDPYWNRTLNQSYAPDGEHPMRDEGPILSFYNHMAAREEAPDWIYLISTDDGPEVREPTKRHGDATRERLLALGVPHVTHLPMQGVNPTDYEMLMPTLRRFINDILHQTQAHHPTYIINQSPGTPQMRAVLYALVHSGVIPAQLYQTEPYKRIHIDLLYEDELKKSALRLLEHFTFEAAAAVLHDLSHRTLDDNRAVTAWHMGQLCTAYWEWNRFDYPQAAAVMRDVAHSDVLYRSHFEELRDLITRQFSVLNELTAPPRTSHLRLIDLYYKAEYLHLVGQYSDSIWRCSGICEHLLKSRVSKYLENQTGLQPDTDQFRKWLQDHQTHAKVAGFTARYFSHDPIPRILGLREALALTDRMRCDVPEIALAYAQHDQVHRLQSLRNSAIHRQTPLTREESEEAIRCARQVLAEYGGFEPQLRDYPFSPRDFETLSRLAERLI